MLKLAVSIVAALVLVAPVQLNAQITTSIGQPQDRMEPRPDTVIATAEGAVRTEPTELRVWVDSAVAEFETAPRDTVAVDLDRPLEIEREVTPRQRQPAVFRDGAPAPDTSTPLPTLVVLALSSLGLGGLLLWRARA